MEFLSETFRTQVGHVLALAFFGLVVFSGFAYPLHYGTGFWPFNCDWFMFSYDTGYDFELEAWSKLNDGTYEKLDVARFFPMRIGGRTSRFQEMPRTEPTMQRLAKYLCARTPAAVAITLREVTWIRPEGQPLPASAIEAAKKTAHTWVADVPCGS